MKRIYLGAALLLLSACATQRVPDHTAASPALSPADIAPRDAAAVQGSPPAPVSTASARSLVGDGVVAQIRQWYNDLRDDCGSATAPAFVCTGVMLRATETNAAFLPWNPNPSSTGVSFSWIRKDTNFSNLVYTYGNGFIFYPKALGIAGSPVIDVRCAFPHDGGTNDRPTLSGCGPSTPYPQASAPCDGQSIRTASAWIAHFNKQANKYTGQCGWSMVSASSADRFKQFILARQSMSASTWAVQNELRMAKWAQNAAVPISAFFYMPSKQGALANARNDQQRYKKTFGKFVPVVSLTLPSSAQGTASFAYNESDQAVPDPGDTGETGCSGRPGAVTFDAIRPIDEDWFYLTPELPEVKSYASRAAGEPYAVKKTTDPGDCPLSGSYVEYPADFLLLNTRPYVGATTVSFDYSATTDGNVQIYNVDVPLPASRHHFEQIVDGRLIRDILITGSGRIKIDNLYIGP